MPALSKFLVPLALFLLASHVHAFTFLSSVAGDQVRVNHLIQLQQPLSKPTNKPSREPIRKPTKQMDLDAKLPNNLSPTKTLVAYSELKQDAELPIKDNDSTNTQIPIGKGQNKQSFSASARVQSFTICSNLSTGLSSSVVHSHAVKVPIT